MLWIGTPAGLDRFDGHSFSRADTQPVSTRALGPDGDLWAATAEGVSRFRENQLKRWELLSPAMYHLGQKNDDVVTCLLIGRDGTIRAANEKGLYRFKSGAFTPVAPVRSMSRLEEAHNSNLLKRPPLTKSLSRYFVLIAEDAWDARPASFRHDYKLALACQADRICRFAKQSSCSAGFVVFAGHMVKGLPVFGQVLRASSD